MSYANITRSWLLKKVYLIRSPVLHKFFYILALKIHKVFLCKKEHILYSSFDGSQNNFCEACGKQVNPNAYKSYEVFLSDGTSRKVKAVNEIHAKNLVIYENTDAINGDTGKPLSNVVTHPDNIKSVQLIK